MGLMLASKFGFASSSSRPTPSGAVSKNVIGNSLFPLRSNEIQQAIQRLFMLAHLQFFKMHVEDGLTPRQITSFQTAITK
jgi:hypothetical protein